MDPSEKKQHLIIRKGAGTQGDPSTLEAICSAEAQTAKVAAALAQALQPGSIVYLEGELGAGKTTFVRHALYALGLEPDSAVPSPTYSLLQDYPECSPQVVHADLYRVEDAGDLRALGLDERLDEGAVLFCEWGLRFADELGRGDLVVTITADEESDQSRYICVRCIRQGFAQTILDLQRR